MSGPRSRSSFDRPVDPDDRSGPRSASNPPIAGTVEPSLAARRPDRASCSPRRRRSRPTRSYRDRRRGARDARRRRRSTRHRLDVQTVRPPGVVRFRPRERHQDVARDAGALGPLHRGRWTGAARRAAFSVTVGGKAIPGKVRWAEGDTVLVFKPPKRRCRTARRSSMKVGSTAHEHGRRAPLAQRRSRAMFQTVGKADRAPSTDIDRRRSGGGGGGGAVGGGSWAAVETYYLGLMNCTRTGGWVTSTGRCSSPGGRNVAPLKLDTGISSKVARPYARKLARRQRLQPLHRRQPGRPPPPRRLLELHAGPRTSAAARATPESAVLGSHLLLPEREVVQRRPLREPDEPDVRPRRDRRLGVAAAGSASWSTSTTPDRTIVGRADLVGLTRPPLRATIGHVIRNAVHPPQQRAAAAGRPVRAAHRRATSACAARTCA